MFTDHYYRLKSIQETIQEKDSGRFCSICFQQINAKNKCNHDLGTQNLESTLATIHYIQEKQIAEAQINGESILVEDSLIPKFYVKGKFNESLNYKLAPMLNLPLIGVIVDDEGLSGTIYFWGRWFAKRRYKRSSNTRKAQESRTLLGLLT